MSGYIYVLSHPSDPTLFKVGVTTRGPKQRLAEHNRDHTKLAGQIVKETGQDWELKEYYEVPDPYWAESVFWGATPFGDVPYRNGVEIERMEWERVAAALSKARQAGMRPKSKEVPDYVYAYTAWMKKRLIGRSISLVGHVRSKYGKSNFRCENGHEWRTKPNDVAEGEGCPICGIGERDPDEVRTAVQASTIYLLVHPDRSGVVRIEYSFVPPDQCYGENSWGDWQVHRYRNVEEPELAQSLIWELLGCSPPKKNEPVTINLNDAEHAFRALVPRMQSEIALKEKRLELRVKAESE